MSFPTNDIEPLDRSIGWKWWSLTQDRWWAGTQWTETYRTYDQPRPPEQVSTVGYPIVVDKIEHDETGILLTGHIKSGKTLKDLGFEYPSPWLSIYGGQIDRNKKENE